MALDEIIAHLDKLTLAEASMWFVEHMTYVSPHRHAVYLYLCERRYSTC